MDTHLNSLERFHCLGGKVKDYGKLTDEIVKIAQDYKHVILVGFDDPILAVHILVNTECKLTCFGRFDSLYSKLCFQHIENNWKNRVEIMKGDVREMISHHKMKPGLIIINTGEDHLTINLEFFMSLEKCIPKAIFVFPIDNPILEGFWEGYVRDGHVVETKRISGFVIGRSTKIIDKMCKIAVCTLTIGEKYKKVVYWGHHTKELYCMRHGYDLRTDEDIYDKSRPPAWSKIKLLLKCLEEDYEYVVWMDADTAIMNHNITLDDIITQFSGNKDMMIAKDLYNFNTGVMFVKNTEWSKKFLNHVYNQTEYINDGNWEQTAIIDLYKANALDSQLHIQSCKQTVFNSYWFVYEDGQFLLHFAGCWRNNVNNGLDRMMSMCYPFRKRNETPGEYKARKIYQKNLKHS